MANRRYKMYPTTDLTGYFTAAMPSTVTDDDAGKPVKLTETDTYELCVDGDLIDAFLVSLEPSTEGGYAVVTLNKGPLVRCKSDGALTVGAFVEAAAQDDSGYPVVSSHTPAVGEVLWRVVSGNTTGTAIATDDNTVVIERI